MSRVMTTRLLPRWAAAVACAAALAGSGIAARAAGASAAAPAEAASASAAAPLHLRIVGGLANVNQYTRHEEPFWSRELPRLSGGRFVGDIIPFDRAGIRGQEMLRLVQLGAVPFGTALLATSAIEDPELGAPDLAGLNADMPALRRSVAAFRPYLERTLHERYGARLLAVFTYPPQVVFCAKPFKGLADLAGRRVRTSSPPQADLMEALGATPVSTGFAEIVPNIRSGNVECAITGATSGNTIGLHEQTHYLHTLAITWGLSLFVANEAAWKALPADLQALLLKELPKLEQAIWAESDRETAEGLACNTGGAGCTTGRKGSMTLVQATPADVRRMRDIFGSTVLPRWVQRCGNQCAAVWNQTLRPATGIEASTR
jgi:TRAP-type C4-dicarboxylate transport system substrate-binding protein